jgi:hypothetical protein
MFKIHFVNFGYDSVNESETLEGAKKICQKAGFQSVVIDKETNVTVASYCPISGFRKL